MLANVNYLKEKKNLNPRQIGSVLAAAFWFVFLFQVEQPKLIHLITGLVMVLSHVHVASP